MKLMKIFGSVVATTFAVAAFGAELQHSKIQNSKEQPQLVVVTAGKEIIAEVKVIKPGTLEVEAEEIVWRGIPGGGKSYNCTGRSKLEVSVEGRSVLKVSGDSMIIQNLKTDSTSKPLK